MAPVRRWLLAALGSALVVGGVVTCTSAAAFGSAQLRVIPATGLVSHQIVAVTGSGLPPKSNGYLVECNMAPDAPKVTLSSPAFDTLPVSCSAPSLRRVVSTSGTGTLAATFSILLGHTNVGPPCGPYAPIPSCPKIDSAGKTPRKDAQNYPCPPTPLQQTVGITCAVMYVDASKQHFTAKISYAGSGLGGGGGGAGGGGGGGGGATTTTPKKTTSTTRPLSTVPLHTTTTVHVVTVANSSGSATTVSGLPTQLANTGPGPSVRLAFLVGVGLAMLGLLLLATLARRRPSRAARAQR